LSRTSQKYHAQQELILKANQTFFHPKDVPHVQAVIADPICVLSDMQAAVMLSLAVQYSFSQATTPGGQPLTYDLKRSACIEPAFCKETLRTWSSRLPKTICRDNHDSEKSKYFSQAPGLTREQREAAELRWLEKDARESIKGATPAPQ